MSKICFDGGGEERKSLEISWGAPPKHLLLGVWECNINLRMSVLTFTGTGFLAQSLHLTH